MKRLLPIIAAAALVAIITIACNRRPKDVLSREDMAELLADIHTAEGVIETNRHVWRDDTLRQQLRQSIYMAHGVSKEEVDSSLKWYGYNTEKYIELYDRVIEILDERVARAQEVAGAAGQGSGMSMSFDGDSVDVWPEIRFRRLSSTMPSNFVTFSLKQDRYWEHGDAYELHAKMVGTTRPAEVTIAAEYIDGSRDYLVAPMPSAGWQSVKFVLDSAKTARTVYGAISYTGPEDEIAFVDSLSLIRTRWGGHQRQARERVKHLKAKPTSHR